MKKQTCVAQKKKIKSVQRKIMKKTRRENGAGIYLAENKGACGFD